MSSRSEHGSEFDQYAEDYSAALKRGLAVSGESQQYFAEERVKWLSARLAKIGAQPQRALDFGCGTGTSMPLLLSHFGLDAVTGVDVSAGSLAVAARDLPDPRARFATIEEFVPDGTYDLAFCNGVFHHIPPPERASAVACVHRALRPGGFFAFWENNPWNPGTRYIMSRVAFDRDAITLTPPEARALLRTGGFEIVRTDFLFIFPRLLRSLRPLEPMLARLPLGGQYLVLARKP